MPGLLACVCCAFRIQYVRRWHGIALIVYFPHCNTMYLVCSRALLIVSGCAVALAQHLGQNSRFAQQTPLGWLCADQHAILDAQHFSPQANKNLRGKNVLGIFFLIRRKQIGRNKNKKKAIRCRQKKNAIRCRQKKIKKANSPIRRGRQNAHIYMNDSIQGLIHGRKFHDTKRVRSTHQHVDVSLWRHCGQ